MSKYKLGMIVGRFQPLHRGHVSIIKQALDECDHVVIFVGSAQESRTKRNPFTFEERKKMLDGAIYKYDRWADWRLTILPLVDIGAGDSPIWGNYILNTCKLHMKAFPAVIYTGSEPDRLNWLDRTVYKGEVKTISRDIIKISGTELREKMLRDKLTKVFPNASDWTDWMPEFDFRVTAPLTFSKMVDIVEESQND